MDAFIYWTATFCFRLLGLIVPALYLLFDIQGVYANVAEAIFYFVPYFVSHMAVLGWLSSGRILPIMSDLSQLLCADAVLKSVAVGLSRPRGRKFKVTAKGRSRNVTVVQWTLLGVFLFYLALTVAGILWAFAIDDTRPLADASGVALAWSWYNLIVLVLASLVTVEASDRRSGDRLRVNRPAILTLDGRQKSFLVADLSVTGMRLIGVPPGKAGTRIHVQLDNLDVDAVIVRADKGGFPLRFAEAPKSRERLIRHVYGGSYNAAVETIRPTAVAGAVIGRLFH